MANYTYDDFLKQAKAQGMLDQFSTYDLALAQNDPRAGLGILSAKTAYNSATDEAGKLAANQRANDLRAYGNSYDSYTAGRYGEEYNPINTPQSYSGKYDATTNDLLNQMLNYGSFSYGDAPTYSNRYDDSIAAALDKVLSRDPFSYDYETDPVYSSYKKQYTREGQRATQDAIGSAAVMTGGIPSSYAVTAATQAGDYYASQMSDKIPELYDMAYNRYLNEDQLNRSDVSLLNNQEQMDYSKYLTDLGQYNTDRSFNYGVWQGGYDMLGNNLGTVNTLDQQDYGRYMDNLNYTQALRQTERSLADAEWERQYLLAQLGADYGDLSGISGLGIDTANYAAQMAAKSSGGTGGKVYTGGGDGKDDGYIGTGSATVAELSEFNRVLRNMYEKGRSQEDLAVYIESLLLRKRISENDATEFMYKYGLAQRPD